MHAWRVFPAAEAIAAERFLTECQARYLKPGRVSEQAVQVRKFTRTVRASGWGFDVIVVVAREARA